MRPLIANLAANDATPPLAVCSSKLQSVNSFSELFMQYNLLLQLQHISCCNQIELKICKHLAYAAAVLLAISSDSLPT